VVVSGFLKLFMRILQFGTAMKGINLCICGKMYNFRFHLINTSLKTMFEKGPVYS